MHKSTMALGGALILLTLTAVLFLAGGTLSARMERVTANAADYPSAFAAIREVVDSGGAPQSLGESLPEDPARCRLEDVTLSLYNPGLVSAEWVSVTVQPLPGDVAVYSVTGEGDTVPARSTGTVNLKLVSASGAGEIRTYIIEYYVFGMKRTVRLTA